MADTKQLALFDYDQLDTPTRDFVQQRTEEIRILARRMANDIVGIGQRLIEIKARLGHGHFGEWLEYEFSWSHTTAWKFMRVAEAFKFSHCENLTIEASALYLLAAPSTPKEARDEAIERAEQGEEITHATAQEIVEEHKDEEPEDEPEPIRFVCPDCGQVFSDHVWHCFYCHSHWGDSQTWCAACNHKKPDQKEHADLLRLMQNAPDLFQQVQLGELTIRQAKSQINRQERVEKVQEISDGNTEIDTDKKYPVIYADPPWRYEHSKTDNRKIENQYPTMELADIQKLPVSELATPDAVLLMWATGPKLAEAMTVIEAWGFTYRTSMVWVKDKIGMGYYARQRHELLLIAARGCLPVPEPANRHDSVVESPRLEHSKKPDVFYEIIESMYPEYAKIELFSRNKREGWDNWGNQA
jgi:N6-adenosine-specific RNA methylase IME4